MDRLLVELMFLPPLPPALRGERAGVRGASASPAFEETRFPSETGFLKRSQICQALGPLTPGPSPPKRGRGEKENAPNPSSFSRLWSITLLAAVLLIPATRGAAAGREHPPWRGEDLAVTIDSRWAGCANGGYYPVRIRATNNGPPAQLVFRFAPDNHSDAPVVTKALGLDQNSTVQFSLSIPMVGDQTSGRLLLEKDGTLIEGFAERLSLPEAARDASPLPALLIISPRQVDATQFGAAAGSLGAMTSGHGGYGGPQPADVQQIPPVMLPKSWIDYSGVDLVAVPLDTFAALDAQYRAPLLQWMHTGGTLIVYDVGDPPGQSQELADALNLDRHAAVSPEWRSADASQWQSIAIFSGGATPMMPAAELATAPESGVTVIGGAPWPRSANTFAVRDLLLGRVVAFPGDPFPGTPPDWAWLLRSLVEDAPAPQPSGPVYHWPVRHGFSARGPSAEFLHFLIPGIGSVPVMAFVILMTLFTLVIGPLNYFWMWRRKQIPLLVITVPVLAFVTSLTLFAWSAASQGFGVKSRVRSLTLLDQQSNTAVAVSRVSLFAGLASSDGLQFSPETAVYPIWPLGEQFNAGTVEWSEAQVLGAGWLRSRTWTQFLTVTHRPERGRLEIQPADGGLSVSNGLEWDIDRLIVADADGRLYAARNIAAGRAVALAPVVNDDLTGMGQYLRERAPQLPVEVDQTRRGQSYTYNRRRGYHPLPEYRFNTSRMEQLIAPLEQLSSNPERLAARSFLAVFQENPDIAVGVENASEQDGVHLMLGYY